jgi:dephospho-CoA kinase
MTRKILAILWMSGTGKSVVIDNLVKEKKYNKVYFWWFVLEETRRLWLEINTFNEKIAREWLREQHGKAAMAVLAEEDISRLAKTNEWVSLDGVYSLSEYEYLSDKYGPDFVCIAIHSTKSLRYKRLSTRTYRPLTREEIDFRDMAELKNIEKGWPIALADFHIINDGSIKELHSKIEEILSRID